MRIIIPLVLALASLLYTSCSPRKDKRVIKSVLILGNSILQHDEAPQLGWHSNWGMAASARDSDFVHLLIREIHQQNPDVTIKYQNTGNLEWNYDNYDFTRIDTFGTPDMLIIRLGENTNDASVTQGGYINNLNTAINRIDPHNLAVKVIVSSFWYRPTTNRLMEQYARKHDYVYVRNDDLLADSTNSAWGLFDDAGVAAHPSDKGMRLIKAKIWEQIKGYF